MAHFGNTRNMLCSQWFNHNVWPTKSEDISSCIHMDLLNKKECKYKLTHEDFHLSQIDRKLPLPLTHSSPPPVQLSHQLMSDEHVARMTNFILKQPVK